MFNEELGSRLRGIGHIVHTFDSEDELTQKLASDKFKVKLVIIDTNLTQFNLQSIVSAIKEKEIPIIAIGAHKDKKSLQDAKALQVDKVIVNSQASKSIETYVNEILA